MDRKVRSDSLITADDRFAIFNLLADYNFSRDLRDIPRLVSLFADDGRFSVGSKVAVGLDEIRSFYEGTTSTYETSNHVTHVPYLEDIASDRVNGLVSGHAELVYEGALLLASYRYKDVYSRRSGEWVFEARDLRFFYLVPVEELRSAFTDEFRVRWPGQPATVSEIP